MKKKIDHLWPVLMLQNDFEGEVLDQIQSEIQRAYQDHIDRGRFVDPWNNERAGVTDGAFQGDLIEDFDMQFFRAVIIENFLHYASEMRWRFKDFRITECWMVQSLKHQWGLVHAHNGSHVSGAYYFRGTETEGDIYFESPMPMYDQSETHSAQIAYYKPKTGRMLMWPGNLRHGVATNTTDRERVSLSFNIVMLS